MSKVEFSATTKNKNQIKNQITIIICQIRFIIVNLDLVLAARPG